MVPYIAEVLVKVVFDKAEKLDAPFDLKYKLESLHAMQYVPVGIKVIPSSPTRVPTYAGHAPPLLNEANGSPLIFAFPVEEPLLVKIIAKETVTILPTFVYLPDRTAA
jgi:hypothetical protein